VTPHSTGAGALAATALVGAVLALAACGDAERPSSPPPASAPADQGPQAAGKGPVRARGGPGVETVATGLEVPWEIDFLPDGSALITERPGRVRLLSRDGRLAPEPVAEVEVAAIGEGGLLGLAIDPRFRRNRFVYIYRTTRDEIEVLRYRFEGGKLRDERRILGGIEVGPVHDSGRLRFGPDERLYLNTGDAGDPSLAQDPRSLNGKTLRMEPRAYRGAGGRPEILTLGHRNGQGLDWQPGTGTLFESEHGAIGNDEINILEKGRNYGWPDAEGREHGGGFTAPVVLYEDGIAPSGASFVTVRGSEWTGDLLIAALVGEQLRRVRFAGRRATIDEPLFEGEFGRLRTVRAAPDGSLYVLTSNRDGRGDPRRGDDRVLRIVPPAG
jgi:glucose/arabinose dehydrogenase